MIEDGGNRSEDVIVIACPKSQLSLSALPA